MSEKKEILVDVKHLKKYFLQKSECLLKTETESVLNLKRKNCLQ